MTGSDLRLYAVSACSGAETDLLEAEAGGATFLQLREKELSYGEFLAKAKFVAARARVPFVVNDDVRIAKESGADGVHVGQGDAPLAEARSVLGNGKIVGVSCTTLEEALAAEAGGADYLGVGAVFPTGTKLDAAEVPFNTLKSICRSVRIPVVAIGGIHAGNVAMLAGSGIAGCAVVSELFGKGNVTERTGRFAKHNDAMLSRPVSVQRGVIVDLDNTLIDSLPVWDEVDRVVLTELGLCTPENLKRLRAAGTIEEAAAALRPHGLSLTTEDFAARVKRELRRAYFEEIPLLPGAKDFLARAKAAGSAVALVTASPEELVSAALQRLQIDRYFDAVVCGCSKSVPADFYRAAEKLGTGLGDTTIYDDSTSVLEFARQAGFEARTQIE